MATTTRHGSISVIWVKDRRHPAANPTDWTRLSGAPGLAPTEDLRTAGTQRMTGISQSAAAEDLADQDPRKLGFKNDWFRKRSPD